MRIGIAAGVVAAACCIPIQAQADGIVRGKVGYRGSLNERAQEAILIFRAGAEGHPSVQDMVLKIAVAGRQSGFSWIVPFPSEPRVERADAKLFAELHRYVRARTAPPRVKSAGGKRKKSVGVDVLSRRTVGSYDITTVRESSKGRLNAWLDAEGYQTIEGGEEVIEHYRMLQYVFVCIKVSEGADPPPDPDAFGERVGTPWLHPLRFTFTTGGRDGIYFPMQLTGLQDAPFDVNLYVFTDSWLNDDVSPFGFEHFGFSLRYRDWDTDECEPNAGKDWSHPERDPLLSDLAHQVPTVAALLQGIDPSARYYLTNIHVRRLEPGSVRGYGGDVWLFPYYTDPDYVPLDARDGGPAGASFGNAARTVPPEPVAEKAPAAPAPAELAVADQDRAVVQLEARQSTSGGAGGAMSLALIVLGAALGIGWYVRTRGRG